MCSAHGSAYFSSNITIRALRHVYYTTSGVDSWGVTLDNLAQPRDFGGYQLPTLKVWLHAQFGLPFHKFLQSLDVFSAKLLTDFRGWCNTTHMGSI